MFKFKKHIEKIKKRSFLAKKHLFQFEQGKKVKVLLSLQVVDHFEFVQKGKQKITK